MVDPRDHDAVVSNLGPVFLEARTVGRVAHRVNGGDLGRRLDHRHNHAFGTGIHDSLDLDRVFVRQADERIDAAEPDDADHFFGLAQRYHAVLENDHDLVVPSRGHDFGDRRLAKLGLGADRNFRFGEPEA